MSLVQGSYKGIDHTHAISSTFGLILADWAGSLGGERGLVCYARLTGGKLRCLSGEDASGVEVVDVVLSLLVCRLEDVRESDCLAEAVALRRCRPLRVAEEWCGGETGVGERWGMDGLEG